MNNEDEPLTLTDLDNQVAGEGGDAPKGSLNASDSLSPADRHPCPRQCLSGMPRAIRIFYPVSYRVLNLWDRERAFIQQRPAGISDSLKDDRSEGGDVPTSRLNLRPPLPQTGSPQAGLQQTRQREALHGR